MFSIYVYCDSGVTQFEREAIKRGLSGIISTFGCEVYFYGSDRWSIGRYKSADEIMRASPRNARGQVNASVTLEILHEVANSRIEPCAVVLITSQDLYAVGYNWCFGMAMTSYRATVQSICRYRHLPDDIRAFCIRRTLRHEVGHLFRCAANLSRTNTEEKCGPHCTNPHCSMKQTMSISELVDRRFYENDEAFLCDQCLEDMRRFKIGYENDERRKRMLIEAAREAAAGAYGTRRL